MVGEPEKIDALDCLHKVNIKVVDHDSLTEYDFITPIDSEISHLMNTDTTAKIFH